MNIISTQYSLSTKSFELYLAGCKGNPHCPSCHNPQTWSFDIGDKYDKESFILIQNKIQNFDSLVDNIWILGGEPLDQNTDELLHLLVDMKSLKKKLWLFTRYDILEIPNEIKAICDFIKCGRYIEELKAENNIHYGVTLSTSNQKIYKKGLDY